MPIFQAVYGGRISGKKEKDLKVNPLYSDRNSVSQYSDINRNMSPVHVVSYESFPGTRTKPQSSENGIIQNGDVLQHTEANRTEYTSNKSEHNTVVGSLNNDSDIIDPSHNAEEDTKGEKLNDEKSNVPKLVYLKYKDSNSSEEYSAVNRDDGSDNVYIESKKLNSQYSKGFHKDYSLLSYNNKSFVLDEKDVVIIAKQVKETNPNTNQYHEIQSLSSHIRTNSVELEDQAESVSAEAKNSVNPNSLEEDELDLNDSNSTKTAPLEKPNSEGLPESLYHEISNVCDTQKLGHHNVESIHNLSGNLQGESFDIGDSPLKCHKEIVTEVLVHNSAVLESPRMILYSSYSEGQSNPFSFDAKNIKVEIPEQAHSSDWPDIDELVRPVQVEKLETSVSGIAQSDESRTETKGHIRSVSDIVIQEKETNEGTENKDDRYSASDMNGSYVYKKKQSKVKSGSKAGVVSEAGSSTRTLKSILSNSSSYHSCSSEIDQKRQNSYSEIQELKTVKFSEDTVFNENKSNKYKKEKFGQINLRDLYRGKIMSEAAVAKMNPLYCPDEGTLEGSEQEADENSEIDNDKLTYQLTLKNAMRLSKGKVGTFVRS